MTLASANPHSNEKKRLIFDFFINKSAILTLTKHKHSWEQITK